MAAPGDRKTKTSSVTVSLRPHIHQVGAVLAVMEHLRLATKVAAALVAAVGLAAPAVMVLLVALNLELAVAVAGHTETQPTSAMQSVLKALSR